MKILMLSQYFQPEPIFKGLPLAKELRARGHEVEVLTGFPNYPGGKVYSGYKIRPWKRETLDGIPVLRTALFPSHSQNGLHRILNFLSFGLTSSVLGPLMVNRPDVIYVYNLVTLAPTFRFIRWRYGAKVVLDVQDLWPESVASSGMLKSRLAMKVLNSWCKRAYNSADRLLTLSPGFKENLINRGIKSDKISVLYNWCDESSLHIPSADLETAKQYGMLNRFNVVFAGTMGIMQSLDVVIHAARKLANVAPDVQFVLVGAGVEVERLKREAAGLTNVKFVPQMPQSKIGEVYANAQALLVHLKDDPIFSITIPSKIQAYMHAGKPILCGVRGDAARLVETAHSGLVFTPEDSESLVESVLKIYNMDRCDREKLGSNGKQFYEDRISFAAGVRTLENVFCELRQGCTSAPELEPTV